MKIPIRLLALSLCLTMLWACSDSSDSKPPPGPYADDALWLCKPGIADNYCLDLDQTITQVYEDGNLAVFEHELASDPQFDCFYVYPTVDYTEEPGNVTDLTDVSLILRPLYNQAARFTSLCAMYAPRYQQMTYGTYTNVDDVPGSEYFATAYADVDEAFSQYLKENAGRNFVLIGHSQGSHMLLELLARRFEGDPAIRERLISALAIGAVGVLEVPEGESAGGTFDNIPLCTYATDTGCIVSYDSVAEGGEGDRPPLETPIPCVNPTTLGGEPGVTANTIHNQDEGLPVPPGVETDWIGYEGVYSAACESDGLLAIGVVEGRSAPLPPQIIQLVLGGTLHQADYAFAMGDLLRLVETQAASMP